MYQRRTWYKSPRLDLGQISTTKNAIYRHIYWDGGKPTSLRILSRVDPLTSIWGWSRDLLWLHVFYDQSQSETLTPWWQQGHWNSSNMKESLLAGRC